jgi:anti-anti-sigma factor
VQDGPVSDVTVTPPVVELTGPLDLATTSRWEADVARAARDSGTVVLDLTNVGFIDSAGVHALFRMLATLDGQGKQLVVVAPVKGRVRRLLDILDLPSLAWVCETVEEALERTA